MKNLREILGFKKEFSIKYKIVPISKDAVCVICGAKKPLDTCHIIPKRFLMKIQNIDKKLLDYDGSNILILCKNHHCLFDRYDLSKEEIGKIWERVYEMGLVLSDIYGRVVGTLEKDSTLSDRQKVQLKKLKDGIWKHIKRTCDTYANN